MCFTIAEACALCARLTNGFAMVKPCDHYAGMTGSATLRANVPFDWGCHAVRGVLLCAQDWCPGCVHSGLPFHDEVMLVKDFLDEAPQRVNGMGEGQDPFANSPWSEVDRLVLVNKVMETHLRGFRDNLIRYFCGGDDTGIVPIAFGIPNPNPLPALPSDNFDGSNINFAPQQPTWPPVVVQTGNPTTAQYFTPAMDVQVGPSTAGQHPALSMPAHADPSASVDSAQNLSLEPTVATYPNPPATAQQPPPPAAAQPGPSTAQPALQPNVPNRRWTAAEEQILLAIRATGKRFIHMEVSDHYLNDPTYLPNLTTPSDNFEC